MVPVGNVSSVCERVRDADLKIKREDEEVALRSHRKHFVQERERLRYVCVVKSGGGGGVGLRLTHTGTQTSTHTQASTYTHTGARMRTRAHTLQCVTSVMARLG